MSGEHELHDDALEQEIELLSDVMERASQTEVPLKQDQVDEALGVEPPPETSGGGDDASD